MCSVTLESFHHMNSKTTLVSLSTTGERSTKAYKIRSRVPQGSFSTKKPVYPNQICDKNDRI